MVYFDDLRVINGYMKRTGSYQKNVKKAALLPVTPLQHAFVRTVQCAMQHCCPPAPWYYNRYVCVLLLLIIPALAALTVSRGLSASLGSMLMCLVGGLGCDKSKRPEMGRRMLQLPFKFACFTLPSMASRFRDSLLAIIVPYPSVDSDTALDVLLLSELSLPDRGVWRLLRVPPLFAICGTNGLVADNPQTAKISPFRFLSFFLSVGLSNLRGHLTLTVTLQYSNR